MALMAVITKVVLGELLTIFLMGEGMAKTPTVASPRPGQESRQRVLITNRPAVLWMDFKFRIDATECRGDNGAVQNPSSVMQAPAAMGNSEHLPTLAAAAERCPENLLRGSMKTYPQITQISQAS